MDLRLEQKTVLVTGSHRGTGQIIAHRFLAEGATVLVHGLEAGQAEASVDEIGGGVPVTGDITNESASAQLLDACATHSIDVLINNYGTADPGSWGSSDEAAWLLAYQKNVLSAQRMIQGLLPSMIDRSWVWS